MKSAQNITLNTKAWILKMAHIHAQVWFQFFLYYYMLQNRQ